MAQVEVLNIDTSSATNSLKSLRQELMSVKNEMTNLEEGSDAFLKAANKAGELKHQIDEINQSVSGASTDFGDMLGTATTALNGIIGGFTAAQGALSLFGIENEDVIKTIKQLQSLMAIGQGIAQIDSGIKAINKLQHAIKGTSVAAKVLRGALTPKSMLLIIAAITTLTKLWEKFGDDIKNSIPLIGKVTEVFDTWNTSIEDNIKKQEELQQAVADTQGKYDELVKNNKISKLNDNAKKSYDELISRQKENNALIDVYQAKLNAAANNEKEWNKIRKEANDALLERDRLAGEINKLLEDPKSYEKPVKAVNKVKTDVNEILTKLKDTGKDLLKDPANPFKQLSDLADPMDQANIALARLDAQYAQGKLTINDYYSSVIEWEEFKLTLIDKNTEAYYKQQLVIEQLRNEANKSMTEMQAGWQDWSTVAQTGIGGVANVLSGLADLQDTTTEEGIQKQAQFQYMAAIMNTANAIIGAWTSAMTLPAPASFILGGIQTAAAAAMGGIEIAKIKKAAEQAKAGLSGSSASVNSGALSSAIIAPIQYSSATQGAQLQSTITDTRVYVTEGDITRTQNKVHVAESENRF